MGDIFIVVDGQPDGPYDAEALRARLASGDFPRDIRASREGDDQWMPLTELIGEAPVATSKSAPPISEAKLRTGAWIALGALFLVAFLFPTPLNEGWGIVNLQTGWVNEHLGWTPIPLMLWPARGGGGGDRRWGCCCTRAGAGACGGGRCCLRCCRCCCWSSWAAAWGCRGWRWLPS